jgi:hypothetical protein
MTRGCGGRSLSGSATTISTITLPFAFGCVQTSFLLKISQKTSFGGCNFCAGCYVRRNHAQRSVCWQSGSGQQGRQRIDQSLGRQNEHSD